MKFPEIKISILFVFLALILAYGSYNTLGTALRTDTPVVTVVSPSMIPEFYKGDLLIVQGVNFSSIQEGDVIVYDAPNMEIPVVHRVHVKKENYLITKGDNNDQVDPWKVKEPMIKGKVLYEIPKIGYLKLAAVEFYKFLGT